MIGETVLIYEANLAYLKDRLGNRSNFQSVLSVLEDIKTLCQNCIQTNPCNSSCENCSIFMEVQKKLKPLRREAAEKFEEFYFWGEGIDFIDNGFLHYIMPEVLAKSLVFFLFFLFPDIFFKEIINIDKILEVKVALPYNVKKIQEIMGQFEKRRKESSSEILNLMAQLRDFVKYNFEYIKPRIDKISDKLREKLPCKNKEKNKKRTKNESKSPLNAENECKFEKLNIGEVKEKLQQVIKEENLGEEIKFLLLSIRCSIENEKEIYWGPMWVLSKTEFQRAGCNELRVFRQLFGDNSDGNYNYTRDPDNYIILEISGEWSLCPLKEKVRRKEFVLFRPTLLDDLHGIQKNFFLLRRYNRKPYYVRCNKNKEIEEYIIVGIFWDQREQLNRMSSIECK